MAKLLIAIVFVFVTALGLLQLRQQRLNLHYQMSRLHREIDQVQAALWTQQVELAKYTAPPAIRQTIGQVRMEMQPAMDLKVDWLEQTQVDGLGR